MRYSLDAHISAAVPHQLRDWLIEEAEREFSTVSQLMRKALTKYKKEKVSENSDVE